MFIFRSKKATAVILLLIGLVLGIFGFVELSKVNGEIKNFDDMSESEIKSGALVEFDISEKNLLGQFGYRDNEKYYFIGLDSGRILTFKTADKQQKDLLLQIEQGKTASVTLTGQISSLADDEKKVAVETLVDTGYYNDATARQCLTPYKIGNYNKNFPYIMLGIGGGALLIGIILFIPFGRKNNNYSTATSNSSNNYYNNINQPYTGMNNSYSDPNLFYGGTGSSMNNPNATYGGTGSFENTNNFNNNNSFGNTDSFNNNNFGNTDSFNNNSFGNTDSFNNNNFGNTDSFNNNNFGNTDSFNNNSFGNTDSFNNNNFGNNTAGSYGSTNSFGTGSDNIYGGTESFGSSSNNIYGGTGISDGSVGSINNSGNFVNTGSNMSETKSNENGENKDDDDNNGFPFIKTF